MIHVSISLDGGITIGGTGSIENVAASNQVHLLVDDSSMVNAAFTGSPFLFNGEQIMIVQPASQKTPRIVTQLRTVADRSKAEARDASPP